MPGHQSDDSSLVLKMQDAPGWGDDVNLSDYARTMITYILEQQEADYKTFNGNRAFPTEYVSGCLKKTVTAVLYFLPPHRVKKFDLILMSAISQLATVIPIIAKADTMTVEETKRYRQEVLERCLNPDLYVNDNFGALPKLRMNFFSYDGCDLEALNVNQAVPPFTLVTSEKLDTSGLPVREYEWGTCSTADQRYSDFSLIKRLLLGDRANSLWHLLDDAYERYGAFCDTYDASHKQLTTLVEDAFAVCGPHFGCDVYLKSLDQVRQLQQEVEQLVQERQKTADENKRLREVQQEVVTHLQKDYAQLKEEKQKQINKLKESLDMSAGLLGIVMVPFSFCLLLLLFWWW